MYLVRMRLAVIDLGTNTFHLLVAEVDEADNYKIVFKTKVAVKLGEGGLLNHTITSAAFKRGLITLKKFQFLIGEHDVDEVHAFATSAMRNAINGQDFVKAAHMETGVKINVISGLSEAEYIYQGVKQAYPLCDEKILIMDIGGGSVEFILADQHKIYLQHSYDIGAARLLQQFEPSDPITGIEVRKIEQYLRAELKDLYEACREIKPERLVGASGSFDTLSDMISHKYHHATLKDGETHYHFRMDEYAEISHKIIRSNHEERLDMKGLIRMRVDMIVIACLIINLIRRDLHLENMSMSSYALKEGVLWSAIHSRRVRV